MITIVDYGMGNIGSLENMIRKVGGEAIITSETGEILEAEKLLLPGVGQFDQAVENLKDSGLFELIDRKVRVEKTPILCICLGAQLITHYSEEGKEEGFGWIRGRTVSFRNKNNLRIPHMGWNDVCQKKESRLFRNIPENPCFYFVHSFHLEVDDEQDVLTTTIYGYEFVSSIEHENIFATQFHPEKSHKYGMCLIKNFLEL